MLGRQPPIIRAVKLSDFDYELPAEMIAQHPARERGASRLLHLDGARGTWHDRMFRELPELVLPGDVLVLNDTRVIKARLIGRKASGGQVEALVERVLDSERALAQLRASKTPRAGAQLEFATDKGPGVTAEVLGRQDEFFELRFAGCTDVFALLERAGSVPLPPYIRRAPNTDDDERYQTVYAREPGAVAAPTAGLHFDAAMFAALKARGAVVATLTLHVGAGTFQLCVLKTLPSIGCTARGTRCRKRPWTPSVPRARRASACWRSAPPACARWNRLLRQESCARAVPKPGSSSCPVTAFALSTGC